MDDTPIGAHRVLLGFSFTAVLALIPLFYVLLRA